MGKEVSTAEKPGLAINRHLSGYVAGTTKLKRRNYPERQSPQDLQSR